MKRYYRKQKAYGAAIAILGLLTAVLLDGDITVAILMVPLGLTVMFTKERVLLDDYDEDEGEES